MITLKEFLKLVQCDSSIRILIRRKYSDAEVLYFVAEGTIHSLFYDMDQFILRMGNPLLESVANNEVVQVESCNDGAPHRVFSYNGGIDVVHTILTIVVSENKLQGDNNERNRSS